MGEGATAEYRRIAVFGGVYSNGPALVAMLENARRRDVEAIFCFGDMGGFGPHPDRVFPLLREGGLLAIQGNYDESLASGRTDCGCGYTDPRDNHYALVSYRYTLLNAGAGLEVEFVPLVYDHEGLARQVEAEGLPPEFAETIRTGWWTTCLENLPSRELQRSRF